MDWKKYLDYKDIRFWLALLFIIRLYAITLPPLERQHPWRQADGLMIARNFYEGHPNIFYPRVDIAGEKTGITGSEFPILNYLIYLVSLVFGYQYWYGRIIVLIVSTLGSWFFYKSIKKFFSETVAFNSTILLTTSYWLSYSRKIFPDCFSAGLILIALYFVLEYLENGKFRHLIFYFILAALGGLAKISCTLLLSSLIIPFVCRNYPVERKMWTSLFSAGVLACIVGWYFFWIPYLNDTFGYGDHFTTGCPLLSMGWDEIKSEWPRILQKLYIVPMEYVGFLLFIGSIIYILWRRQWVVLMLFLIPYLCFLLVILKTGKSIISDQYYILCVIPVMAFVAGYGLAQVPNRKIMLFVLTAVVVENIIGQRKDFRRHRSNTQFENLESIVDRFSKRNDLFCYKF
ncbi:MAG: glycosyltransferase family 39 protein [Chryseolinea sp.]